MVLLNPYLSDIDPAGRAWPSGSCRHRGRGRVPSPEYPWMQLVFHEKARRGNGPRQRKRPCQGLCGWLGRRREGGGNRSPDGYHCWKFLGGTSRRHHGKWSAATMPGHWRRPVNYGLLRPMNAHHSTSLARDRQYGLMSQHDPPTAVVTSLDAAALKSPSTHSI